jgi:hypothetical protein
MDVTSKHLNEPTNPDVRHERSDVSVSGIFIAGMGLLAAAVIIHLIIWWLFDHFVARAARSDRPLPALAARVTGESLPPEPRLQVSPSQDLREMHAAEDAILNSYGWEDQQVGVVRIPIDRALQVLAERGLPVQSQTESTEGEKRRNGEMAKREN